MRVHYIIPIRTCNIHTRTIYRMYRGSVRWSTDARALAYIQQ